MPVTAWNISMNGSPWTNRPKRKVITLMPAMTAVIVYPNFLI